MPPNGYDSITVSKEVSERLLDYGSQVGADSKAEAIEELLDRREKQPDIATIRSDILEVKDMISMLADPGVVADPESVDEMYTKLDGMTRIVTEDTATGEKSKEPTNQNEK
jgi:predicted CopG family antitoxin